MRVSIRVFDAFVLLLPLFFHAMESDFGVRAAVLAAIAADIAACCDI